MAKRRRRRYIPKDLVHAKIENLSHDGRGIAHINAKTTFIFNALPDEEVIFRYINTHNKFDEGISTKIVAASSLRQTPKCEHFGVCGGCSLQHMSQRAQLELKQKTLLEQLHHFGQITPKILLEPLTGPTWGYRHKARLSVRYVHKKEKVLVGFREIASGFVADLNQCDVLHPSVGRILPLLKTLLLSLDAYKDIAQIEVAVGSDKTALILRNLTDLNENDLTKLKNFAIAQQLFIYLQPKGIDSIYLFWPKQNDHLVHYHFPEYDLKLNFHPSEFSQVNLDINKKMIAKALEFLELQATDNVLDLFCGVGNFTLPIAKNCQSVVGIEGLLNLVERARFNAQQNNITNTTFYCADLSQDMSENVWAQQKYDKILLDPARSGALEMMPIIAKLAPKIIVYISCNPATLARDIGKLVNNYPYRLEKAGIMDMFPHTKHVESIAVLKRKC